MESGVLPHRLKYDVFLSFRGGDTRKNFCERLYVAFCREQIRVFRDNEGMERGDVISPSLDLAMENSAASVIILSTNYANSSWCLDEMAMLCDLRSSLKRPIIPIFYGVNPSCVRKQSDPFKKHFDEHAKEFDEKKIQRWRQAMNVVGSISGFCIEETVDDDMIGVVVKGVLAKVRNTPEKVADYPVGLESCVKGLMDLLNSKSSSGVQILGLYGMGGIGKTTLAKSLYNKINQDFEPYQVFIENVRQKSSTQDGLFDLQRTLSSKLLQGEEKKKILVVLDDVDNMDVVNALIGERSLYAQGSLIVITTRDKEILNRLSADLPYEVKCLTQTQALKLFSYYSLRKENPTDSLLELSKKIVQITGLLPLAVIVFGSHLYDKDQKEWPLQLEKLKDTQLDQLHGVLTLSFESLDDEVKKVFLDIGCLFLEMEIKREEIVDILRGCGIKAEVALSVLVQKSLVMIKEDDTMWVHDQIRDMGRQMVLKESSDDFGMRSRLWDRGEIMNVLDYKKGTTSIRGIVFDFKKKFVRETSAEDIALWNLQTNPGINSVCNYLKNKFVRFTEGEKPESSEITLRVESFVPMTKLRLLQINNVELKGNLKLLPSELKWIQWKGCPLDYLPSHFLGGQLAVLDLSESGIKRVQSLGRKGGGENLKVINLRGCHSLEAIPDLSNHIALEKLVLERCNLLVKVHSSVGSLKKLLHLDLRNCSNLSEFLVDVSGLKSLQNLFLSGCSKMSVLPKQIGDMSSLKKLLLDGTAIKSLPVSISHLQKLEKLSLNGCMSIQELPSGVGTLTSLEKLYLDHTALETLPSSIKHLKRLQKLHLRHCRSLSEIPEAINELISLKELFINGSSVKKLPLTLGKLSRLTDFSAGDCKNLEQIPSSIGKLNSLLHLQLYGTPIVTLPKEIGNLHFIHELDLGNCKSLNSLPKEIGNMDTLSKLYLEGSNIGELPEDFGKLENLVILRMNMCTNLKSLPKSFGDLKSLHHLYMEETSVVKLPESFGKLSDLRVLRMLKKPLFRGSNTEARGTSEEPHCVELPKSFSNLSSLEELDARSWGISGKIRDDLERLSSLETLNLGNNYFHSLPSSLVGLSKLKEVSLYDCRELKCLPPLPSKVEKLNLANCFSLESISDLSELTILHELNLTNCKNVNDIPGLENLKALKRLYMSGCNSYCSLKVKERLSKVSLKMLRNLSLPGNRIPDWFSEGPLMFSAQPNRELRGIILAVVVAPNHETAGDDYQLSDVVEVQAQILQLDLKPKYFHTLNLSGVSKSSDDQLHICRYSAFHPMVTMLKDGYTIQVKKLELPFKQVEMKMHGIHLVYEGDDDIKGKEHFLAEAQQTVSQKLANFFSSFSEGEAAQKVNPLLHDLL